MLLYHVLCRLLSLGVKIDLEQKFVGFELLVVVQYAFLAVMLSLVIPLFLVRLLRLVKELVSIKGFAEYALEQAHRSSARLQELGEIDGQTSDHSVLAQVFGIDEILLLDASVVFLEEGIKRGVGLIAC